MKVYALTPTGARPEGIALLAEYINAQTYKGPLTWIIVDDCDPATRVPVMREGIEVNIIRPDWRWKPGLNTQARCMAEALFYPGFDDRVLILEDDDVYLPGHIGNLLKELETIDLVGEKDTRYYNVTTRRCRVLPGRHHSSMCSVACKGWATDHLKRLCESGGKMLDVRLWQTFDGTKKLLSTHNVVGIKGLPGRPGIGVGHRANFGTPDAGAVLNDWIGNYADNYNFFRQVA